MDKEIALAFQMRMVGWCFIKAIDRADYSAVWVANNVATQQTAALNFCSSILKSHQKKCITEGHSIQSLGAEPNPILGISVSVQSIDTFKLHL